MSRCRTNCTFTRRGAQALGLALTNVFTGRKTACADHPLRNIRDSVNDAVDIFKFLTGLKSHSLRRLQMRSRVRLGGSCLRPDAPRAARPSQSSIALAQGLHHHPFSKGVALHLPQHHSTELSRRDLRTGR